ncbi:hypothetical protein SSCHL_1273 [Staphylococcus schleiferi]|nr:hypothetical protein SSCHL_1273 [Staphylococcus schleiferi]
MVLKMTSTVLHPSMKTIDNITINSQFIDTYVKYVTIK